MTDLSRVLNTRLMMMMFSSVDARVYSFLKFVWIGILAPGVAQKQGRSRARGKDQGVPTAVREAAKEDKMDAHEREPCPHRIIDDLGGAFGEKAIPV